MAGDRPRQQYGPTNPGRNPPDRRPRQRSADQYRAGDERADALAVPDIDPRIAGNCVGRHRPLRALSDEKSNIAR